MEYDAYFELTEKTGWRITDIDWAALAADAEAGRISKFDRDALVGTAVIEHGVPHYAEVWSRVRDLHSDWQLWQFTTLWTGEEHRHSYALQKACDVIGLHAALDDDLAAVTQFAFADAQKDSCSNDCYSTIPGMVTYAMIQELATNRFYTMAQKAADSPTLKDLLSRIAGDEMRHHVFFRDALKARHDAATDKAEFCELVFRAAQSFKMPHLLYHLQEAFFEGGNWDIGVDMKMQLARCFSFDIPLVMRLAEANPVVTRATAAA